MSDYDQLTERYEDWLTDRNEAYTTDGQLYAAAMLLAECHADMELAERLLDKVSRGEAISG